MWHAMKHTPDPYVACYETREMKQNKTKSAFSLVVDNHY